MDNSQIVFNAIKKVIESDVRLNVRQLGILYFVCKQASTNRINNTVYYYSNYLKISKPAVCKSLNKLEALNFIKRSTDQNDQRKINVYPTDKGITFFNKIFENNNNTRPVLN